MTFSQHSTAIITELLSFDSTKGQWLLLFVELLTSRSEVACRAPNGLCSGPVRIVAPDFGHAAGSRGRLDCLRSNQPRAENGAEAVGLTMSLRHLRGECLALTGSMERRPNISVPITYVCPRCNRPDAEVLPIVGGAFCCCRPCGHLWVDERPMLRPEPPLKRRSTDNAK